MISYLFCLNYDLSRVRTTGIKLPPCSGSAALRQLNHIHKIRHKNSKAFTCCVFCILKAQTFTCIVFKWNSIHKAFQLHLGTKLQKEKEKTIK